MHLGFAAPVQVRRLAGWLDAPGCADLPTGMGGPMVTSLLGGLLERGLCASVVTLDPDLDAPVVLEGPRLRLWIGPLRQRHAARDGFARERRFVHWALVQAAPDVVNAHWSYEFALGAVATGLPTVVSVHDWAPRVLRHAGAGTRAHFAVRAAMQARSLAGPAVQVANSPVIARRLARVLRRPVPVIPNALCPEHFSLARPRRGGGPPTVLAASNGFSPLKNVTRLLEAFSLVRTRLPEARLVLAGEGHGPGGPADRWAAAAGLQPGVSFLGPLSADELRAQMDTADVLAHPSLEESFGNVIVEAMARRLPVVAGRNSGAVPWVLGDGRAGCLTDVCDPAALGREIHFLLTDAAGAAALGEAGFAEVWARFRVGPAAERYHGLLAGVAAAGPRPVRSTGS